MATCPPPTKQPPALAAAVRGRNGGVVLDLCTLELKVLDQKVNEGIQKEEGKRVF